MDATQSQQWDDFACTSKALIAAAAAKKIPLTDDEYRAKYEKFFPSPIKHYGGLNLLRFFVIAKDIGLGSEMDLLWPYSKAKEKFDEGKSVFVFSGLHLCPSRSDDFSHASFLERIDDQKFRVNGLPLDLPVTDWVAKRCCAIVLL